MPISVASARMNILNIISSTLINPLAIVGNGMSSEFDVNINTMGKLNRTKPVILVDTSYWLYYRFFALRNWYKKAFPTVVAGNPNFDMEHKWLEDAVFMEKYRKLFIENIKAFVRKYRTTMQNVIFCIDCSYRDIWRNSHTTEYKANRPESLKKKQFNSFDVFAYMKKDYLPLMQVKYGVKILYNSRCEADDIIGQFAPFLVANGVSMVYIVANDNDYMQICGPRVHMLRGGASVPPANYEIGDGKRYLVRKILLGDVSDNIRACMISKVLLDKLPVYDTSGGGCGVQTGVYNEIMKSVTRTNIELLLADEERYSFFLQLLECIRTGDVKDCNDPRLMLVKGFYENTRLMDFQMIPHELQNELAGKFRNLLGC